MTPVLEAHGLVHAFGGGTRVLDGIGLVVEEGELVVLAGRNGAGKTVLAKCLAGLEEPDAGLVSFRGTPLLSLPGSPASRVAYLYQDARLQILGESVLEDALFGPLALGKTRGEAEAVARPLLEEVGLSSKLEWLPYRLSGGEQRRLAIASALALGPPVLILDEPFANLDWESIAGLIALLSRLRREGRTLIVLTHELDKILGLASRLVVLAAGKVAIEGGPAEVLGTGVERYGLRDPLRHGRSLEELVWTS